MLWTFVESCARGHLPVAECSPVYQFAAVAIWLLIVIAGLIWLILKRRDAELLEVSNRPPREPVIAPVVTSARWGPGK